MHALPPGQAFQRQEKGKGGEGRGKVDGVFPFSLYIAECGGEDEPRDGKLGKKPPFFLFFLLQQKPVACGDGTPNKDDKTIVEGLGNW